MVGRWRRAFCTAVRERDGDDEKKEKGGSLTSQRFTTPFSFGFGFGFFSNPSTPRGSAMDAGMKLGKDEREVASTPSSPQSAPSLLKSLRFSKTRCGICSQRVKSGCRTAIFTGECSHSFHFSCITRHVSNQASLLCPICGSNWNELPLFGPQEELKQPGQQIQHNQHDQQIQHNQHKHQKQQHNQYKQQKQDLKIYNDDEPLTPSTSAIRCNPIPEEEDDEFRGLFVTEESIKGRNNDSVKIEARLHPEAAIISSARNHETVSVVLQLKAISSSEKKSTSARRSPIDLVTVLDLSRSKIEILQQTMRLVISFLSSTDRLSIVASSSTSKRLLPLRRMTSNGRRSARRIVDELSTGIGASSAINEAVLKAAKVVDDRRENNPSAIILLLSTNRSRPISCAASARFIHLEIPGHVSGHEVGNCIKSLLTVVARDVRVQLGLPEPGEVVAVYSRTGRPAVYDANSVRLGDFYSDEEREVLLEVKLNGPHHGLSIRCSHRDPSSREVIPSEEQTLVLPRPHPVKSSSPSIVRLRNVFITRRAIAESRRVNACVDSSVALRLLSSARALLAQSGNAASSEYVASLEAEMEELRRRHRIPADGRRKCGYASPEEEALTPTSAWRAAERLAKVAIMRKSLNRVSDLHGFENARF